MYWRPTNLPDPTKPHNVKLNQNAQVFSHDQVLEWKAVTVSQDSISGIPVDSATTCLGCRHALSRADVDSVRVQTPSTGEKVVGVATLLILVAVTFAVPDH
jgi:hypothetical protein